MRPIRERLLLRYDAASVVAAKPMAIRVAHVSNLLWHRDGKSVEDIEASGINMLRVMILRNWDEMAGCGGFGGCRNLSFAPEPFSGAA